MKVIAYVLPDLLSRLRAAVSPGDEILPVRDAEHIIAQLLARSDDLHVIDPSHDVSCDTHNGRSAVAEAACQAVMTTPMMIYTHWTPASKRLVCEMVSAGVQAVVLARIDDSPDSLRSEMRHAITSHASGYILACVLNHFGGLDPRARDAIVVAFQHPRAYSSADVLARRVSLSRRSLDRALARAGIAGAHHVTVAARVVRAYLILMRHEMRVCEVTVRVGYPRYETFRADVERVFGVPPGVLGSTHTPRDTATSAIAYLSRGR